MAPVSDIVEKYQEILEGKVNFRCAFNKKTFGPKGIGNLYFYSTFVHEDRNMFHDFLREADLLKSVFFCQKCRSLMRIRIKGNTSDGVAWVCRKIRNGKECGTQRTIRYI